jgi:hypothetical protein
VAGVQLIATTHSPLVVGSARRGEVISLRRDDEAHVEFEVLDEDFAGWRSDQILTSSAFDMETTRDRETGEDLKKYRMLMAQGRTPANDEEAQTLHERLERNRPGEGETPADRLAAELFRDWLQSRLRATSEEERTKVIGAAEQYLQRLQRGGTR